MPLSLEQRVQKATEARRKHARRRRFQNVIGEMRDLGLVVHVREELGDGSFRDAPEYTCEAVDRARGFRS